MREEEKDIQMTVISQFLTHTTRLSQEQFNLEICHGITKIVQRDT
jgi:hypothetical protein